MVDGAVSLQIEPPRPGHAFGQVVRAHSGVDPMHGSWSNMHVESGAVLDPTGDRYLLSASVG